MENIISDKTNLKKTSRATPNENHIKITTNKKLILLLVTSASLFKLNEAAKVPSTVTSPLCTNPSDPVHSSMSVVQRETPSD